MLTICEATKWLKCSCCGEQIRTCEKYLQAITPDGNPIRGERYCLDCEAVAHENNPDHDEESHLRQMEDFAAYRAAGVSSDVYFADRDAGFCN